MKTRFSLTFVVTDPQRIAGVRAALARLFEALASLPNVESGSVKMDEETPATYPTAEKGE